MSSARATTGPAPAPAPGLRERKKIKTRKAIRREAYRLFEEQGYDATTVEQICAAAEVSPSTFFRYFPSKEEVVLTDEYDALMHEALLARPSDEPLYESVRHVIKDLTGQYLANEPEEVRQRMRLIQGVPLLRARMREGLGESHELLRDILARRTGLAADSLEVRVFCGALVGAVTEGFLAFSDEATPEAFFDIIDRSIDVLANGLPTR